MALPASVVVPSLDAPLLGETIDALERQSVAGADLEIVVAGRDGHGVLRGRHGVRFVDAGEALSAAGNRNLGAAAARGARLLFTDADCRPRPDWAERLLAALDEAPIAGGAVEFALAGNPWAVADNIASFHDFLDRPAEADTRRPIGSLNLAVRRETWEALEPFDPGLPTSEDFDWIVRARDAGRATAFEPRAVVEHAAVRRSREELERHAAWYGASFMSFVRKHGLERMRRELALGAGWEDRERLRAASARKALIGTIDIFRRHPRLLRAAAAARGVYLFKRAWYRSVVEHWS